MSTKKPRITITLEPRSYEVLSRLSAVGGDSMSQIVSQFVDLALPSLERLVLVLERARSATKETHVGLAAALERAERDLIPALESTLKQRDMFFSVLEALPLDGPPTDAQQPAAARPAGGLVSIPTSSTAQGQVLAAVPPAASVSPSTPVPVTRGSGTPECYKLPAKRGRRVPV
jgi:hypothetical protein